MKEFFQKNKVFISGLIGSLIVVLQGYVGKDQVDLKALGIALGVAALSYVANQWKGKGFTILGIIGTLAGVFYVELSDGVVAWPQVILSALVSVGLALYGPPTPTEPKDAPEQ